jgi:hypothetical protein
MIKTTILSTLLLFSANPLMGAQASAWPSYAQPLQHFTTRIAQWNNKQTWILAASALFCCFVGWYNRNVIIQWFTKKIPNSKPDQPKPTTETHHYQTQQTPILPTQKPTEPTQNTKITTEKNTEPTAPPQEIEKPAIYQPELTDTENQTKTAEELTHKDTDQEIPATKNLIEPTEQNIKQKMQHHLKLSQTY